MTLPPTEITTWMRFSFINLSKRSNSFLEQFQTQHHTCVCGLSHLLIPSWHWSSSKKFLLFHGIKLDQMLAFSAWRLAPSLFGSHLWQSLLPYCLWWMSSNASCILCVFTGSSSRTSSSRVPATSTSPSRSSPCSTRRWTDHDVSKIILINL